jgi:hypothetical protein
VNLYVGGDPSSGGGAGANKFTAALGGATFPAATTLWGDVNKMLGYDILVMSCEGGQFATVKLPFINNIKRYADAGGRLFNDHLHFYWLRNGPAPWPTTATYIGAADKLLTPIAATLDTTFPKGAALSAWLTNTGATTTPGQIQLYSSQHSVTVTNPALSQQWIYVPVDTQDPMMRQATQYLTFNTPVESTPANQCGRVVFTDIHVSSASGDSSHPNLASPPDPPTPFPTGCTSTTLAPQEKALEFMFFDLSSCVQQDTVVPQPPIIVP